MRMVALCGVLSLIAPMQRRTRACRSAAHRTLVFVLVLLFSPAALCAQPGPAPAELEKKIAAAPSPEKSALLLALSVSLDAQETDIALDAARRARAAALTPHDELLADARLATLQRRRGDLVEAFATARTALTRATELGDEPARAELLLAFARCNWSLGDFPATSAAHQELVALAERLGNRTLLARAHLGISVVYGEMKEGAKARAEEEIALALAREIGDRELESDALNNLGNNYRNAGEPARARAIHTEALAIRTAIGNRRGMGDSHINLSEIARSARDFPTALDHVRRALAIYEELGLKRYVSSAHLQFAAILRVSGRLDEARERLRVGFALAEPLGSQTLLVNYHREFSALAEARGDWRAAFDAQRKLAVASDAVLGEKSRQQLATLNARYEADRRQQEIALLRGERARQAAELHAKDSDLLASEADLAHAKTIRLTLGISLLCLAIALGATIALQRVRLRAERRILEETRAARDAAEEADRVKTRFLGIASHDIRAPLGNIVNLTDGLRGEPTDASVRSERLDVITSEAQRVLCLVEDLLATAALDSGKLELRPAPTDLTEIAHAVVGSLRWQAAAKRQALVLHEPSPDIGLLSGDAARLYQVVANLVSNAIKFSPPGSKVTLSFARTTTVVNLSVRDEGPGISAEEIARLFIPFGRLSPQPTGSESSHGLGLSIAHEIVRLHGGTIQVASQPGQGATFTVSLPV